MKREGALSSFDENDAFPGTAAVSSDENLEKAELIREVNKTVSKLPEKCREIFVMCKFDGLSYKEIAEIQNISINTVKTLLKRAMKFLSENLIHLKSLAIFIQFLMWYYFLDK